MVSDDTGMIQHRDDRTINTAIILTVHTLDGVTPEVDSS